MWVRPELAYFEQTTEEWNRNGNYHSFGDCIVATIRARTRNVGHFLLILKPEVNNLGTSSIQTTKP